jgi:hypothetical protein
MCFFTTGYTGAPGPQSSADIAAGGYRPTGNITTSRTTSSQTNTGNPHSDAATSQGRKAAVTSKQTADRNTMRRADSYGSRQASATSASSSLNKKTNNSSAVASGKNIMSALNSYNKNKKTILGS